MKSISLFPKRSPLEATKAPSYPWQASTSTAPRPATRRAGGRWIALGAAVLVVTVAALLALALFLPVRISLDETGFKTLSPDTPIAVVLPHLGASVVSLEVTEAIRDFDGSLGPERPVAARLAPDPDAGWLTPRLALLLERQDGARLLQYDRVYRLRVALRTETPAFPFPVERLATREYEIDTPVTPQIRVPAGVVAMDYQQPLELRWNSPLQDFSVEAQPATRVRSWIDPTRPDIGYVELPGAEQGAQYRLQVTRAVGVNGTSMAVPASWMVETAASPHPVGEPVKLEGGDRVVIRWDRGVRDLRYSISPAVASSLLVDRSDPRLTSILLVDPQPQQEYRVKVTDGSGVTGAPIPAGIEFKVVTPPALEVVRLLPKGDFYGVSRDSAISITFSQPIEDRAAAEAAISIQPALTGGYQWPSSSELRFVPTAPLPPDSEIEVQIAGGSKGVRGTDGSRLQEDYHYSFLTQPDKLIDVDLSRQTMTLYEADRVVYSGLVAAGVAGAPTPTGSFMIDYKMPKTRMRGVNPDGSRYDIPDVPWVMSFQGDYTFHGAPWRTRFGYPGSAGCVSMETAQARLLYDWSPVGTPVKIHY